MACRDYHFYNWNCAIPILEQNPPFDPKKRNFHPLLTIYIIILYIYYNSFEILGNLRMFFIPPHLLYSFIPIQTSNKHFHYAVDKKKLCLYLFLIFYIYCYQCGLHGDEFGNLDCVKKKGSVTQINLHDFISIIKFQMAITLLISAVRTT